MTLDITPTHQTLSTALKEALGLPAPVNTSIHENDQMFTFIVSTRGSDAIGRSDYFTSGAQLMKILEQLVQWKFGSFDNVPALLDFASGYGRLTRFLVQKMPPDRIWVSDIQADAVAFQQAEFGVNGFVSTTNPEDLVCDRTFDCIFVASLFSHLPEATFTRWLKKLYTLLSPGGLLAFSLNYESRLPAGVSIPETGIWFARASEVASIDTEEYGTTIVTEPFVRRAVTAATGRPVYHRIPYGLLFHQDIDLLVNEPSPDFSTLHYAHLPHGVVDYALWTAPGVLYVRGWAADMGGEGSPVEVQIFVDGDLRRKCLPSLPRPDVRQHFGSDTFLRSGFESTFELPDHDSTRWITIKAKSSSGAESLVYLGSIATLLPTGKAESCLWIKPDELYVRGWAVDTAGPASSLEVQVFVNGHLRQRCVPSTFRPEMQAHFEDDRFLRSGWECSFQLSDSDPNQLVEVKSVSSTGVEWLLYSGSIAFLEAQGNLAFGQQREPLIRLEADLRDRMEYIRHLESEIARKNDAIVDLESRLRQPQRRLPWQRH